MRVFQADQAVHEVPEEEDENENDISIETTQDGMLKLCCSDPKVLQVRAHLFELFAVQMVRAKEICLKSVQAAQEALSEYLRARARPSAEEREKRKERRKSMPLQASHPEPPPKVLYG